MGYKQFLLVCATLVCVTIVAVSAQGRQKGKIPLTRFTCIGKTSGYYADVDTGCQVYHMCDGLGRQFSYKCPNMTLFQQRMLICDHWYMVNCSMSERDYDANLLIGQRDKPFVSDDEMRLRTPRPDILSVPPYNPYFDVLREDAQLPDVDNDLDTRQSQNQFRPPSSWSTGTNNRRKDTIANFGPSSDNLDQAASQEPEPTYKPTPSTRIESRPASNVTPPSKDLQPPVLPATQPTNDEDSAIDQSTEAAKDPVFQFIKRFDPTSADVHQTAMSKSEILDLNSQLPEGQVSSEEERTPRKHKNFGNNFNTFQTDNDKSFNAGSRFDSVNTKTKVVAEAVPKDNQKSSIPEPVKELLPPKKEYSQIPTTTVGPPIYYEWRWAVPAFDLVPPKQSNDTNSTTPNNNQQTRSVSKFEGRNPFSTVTRPTPITTSPEPELVEYNISSYFVPDYVFPLDKAHPGYEDDDAQTSFQVHVPRPGRASYGENPDCPQCHPAYLNPGSCEPCIVKR